MARLLIASTIAPTLSGFLLPFARHFRARGWRVDAMARDAPKCDQCRAAFDRTWDATWSRNPLDPRNLVRTPGAIRRLVRREGYDLVHVHTPVAAFVTRYALRGLRRQRRRRGRIRLIYTAHGFHFYQGGRPLRNALFLNLEKTAGHWTDYLVLINREDEQAAKRHRIVPPERVHYMPGIGLDTDFYAPQRVTADQVRQVRSEIGLGPRDKLFLMTAEFIPRKRHDAALLALARGSRSAVHLAFAGQGPLMDKMRALASELGIGKRVHFLGSRRDIPVLMRTSVGTLLPSAQEGLPRSVMESLSMEVPVIGADIRGTRDLLQDGCGLLVRPGDVEALASAMTWLVDHEPEAAAIGRRGRERMVGAHDVRQIIAMHEDLYREALQTREEGLTKERTSCPGSLPEGVP